MVGVIGVFIFQDKIIFQADQLDQDYIFKFNHPYKEYFVTANDGEQLNVLLFPASESPKGLIVYFHGNADNLQRWGNYAVDFTGLGYDVLMMDFRGFGKSLGIPSEQALYEDGDMIWEWAKQEFEHEKWIVYGRSLGTAVASHVAIKANPDLLILETPFDEISQGLPDILFPNPSENQFSNKDHLQKIQSRIVIIQGTDDWVVSESSAKRLIPYLKPGDDYVSIPGGGHKNLSEFDLFQETLRTLLQ